jgi:PAS domain S-box-containing protein
LKVGAAPSLPTSFTHALDGTEIVVGVGPCSLAALGSELVIAENFERDERWSRQYRHLALSHQLRACWCSPIRSLGGPVLGTFSLYYREPRSPTPAEENIIEQFTHIASIAIERSQREDASRRMQRYQAEAQRLSRTGSFSWDVRTGEITWSDEVYRIYGYEPTVKPTMELARRRLHPDDVALFNETARRALHDGNEIQFGHRLLMPDGSVKWLQIVSTAVRDGSGKVVEYIGAVRDVTEQRRSDTR